MNNFLIVWDRGLTLVVSQATVGIRLITDFLQSSSFGITEQIVFLKRLSMMLYSGMPIVNALQILESQASTATSKSMIKNLTLDVSSGRLLSVALLKYKKKFGLFCINIIRVGEVSGTLPLNLEYIAQELKKRQELRRQIVGALLYPLIIIVTTLLITGFLVLYIFPKILPIFLSLKAALPLSTQILILISDFLTSYWYVLCIGFVLVIILYPYIKKIPKVRYGIDTLLLRLPVCGRLCMYYNLTNIFRTLGLLLSHEVRIAEALEITSTSTSNLVYVQFLEDAIHAVLYGQQLSFELKNNSSLFPPMCTQMIQVGESTGNLGATLTYLSDTYEVDMRDWIKNLTTILEPLLMLLMGLCVGFIAISIITPIYGITQNLQR